MKNQLRDVCKKRLRDFAAADQGQLKLQAEQQLQAHLALLLQNSKGPWGTYQAMPTEAQPMGPAVQTLSLQWAYPQIQGDDLQWSLAVHDGNSEAAVAMAELEGILIPGLAFTAEGVRLGRGRGYFDRALADYPGKKVGVAFECQLLPEIPCENHDVKMDVVVTELGKRTIKWK